ncbi:MAG: hypothetical protein TREMPRED_004866, partial [Tremellales sp. Tagirdzhanova-0007]
TIIPREYAPINFIFVTFSYHSDEEKKTSATMWRTAYIPTERKDTRVCNACGIYWKEKGRDRPRHLWGKSEVTANPASEASSSHPPSSRLKRKRQKQRPMHDTQSAAKYKLKSPEVSEDTSREAELGSAEREAAKILVGLKNPDPAPRPELQISLSHSRPSWMFKRRPGTNVLAPQGWLEAIAQGHHIQKPSSTIPSITTNELYPPRFSQSGAEQLSKLDTSAAHTESRENSSSPYLVTPIDSTIDIARPDTEAKASVESLTRTIMSPIDLWF